MGSTAHLPDRHRDLVVAEGAAAVSASFFTTHSQPQAAQSTLLVESAVTVTTRPERETKQAEGAAEAS